MVYILYATGENGEGYVQEIGRFANLEEIEIRNGLFANDVVFSIEDINDGREDPV